MAFNFSQSLDFAMKVIQQHFIEIALLIGVVILVSKLLNTKRMKTYTIDFAKLKEKDMIESNLHNWSNYKYLYRGSKLLGKIETLGNPTVKVKEDIYEPDSNFVQQRLVLGVLQTRSIGIGNLRFWFAKRIFAIDAEVLKSTDDKLIMPFNIDLLRHGKIYYTITENSSKIINFLNSYDYLLHYDMAQNVYAGKMQEFSLVNPEYAFQFRKAEQEAELIAELKRDQVRKAF